MCLTYHIHLYKCDIHVYIYIYIYMKHCGLVFYHWVKLLSLPVGNIRRFSTEVLSLALSFHT